MSKFSKRDYLRSAKRDRVRQPRRENPVCKSVLIEEELTAEQEAAIADAVNLVDELAGETLAQIDEQEAEVESQYNDLARDEGELEDL